MLTRCISVSVASSLHSIPGATCSHSGSDHCGAGGSTGSWLVSSAMRSANRVCSELVGRRTSVGQETNLSTTRRKLSNSRRQSGHEAICASAAATSLAGRTWRAYAHDSSAQSFRFELRLIGLNPRQPCEWRQIDLGTGDGRARCPLDGGIGDQALDSHPLNLSVAGRRANASVAYSLKRQTRAFGLCEVARR
jgi:hypothetical protein